jgi:hypothetical protein
MSGSQEIQSMCRLVDIAPKWSNFCGLATYGLVNGCQDLLLFLNTNYHKLHISGVYYADYQDKSHLKVETFERDGISKKLLTPETCEYFTTEAVFDVNASNVKALNYSLNSSNTMYFLDSFKFIFQKLFSFQKIKLIVNYVQETTSTRVQVTTRKPIDDNRKDTIAEGFLSNLVISGNVNFSILDSHLILILLFWMFQTDLKHYLNKYHDIPTINHIFDTMSAYTMSILKSYVLSTLHKADGVKIVDIQFEFIIERNYTVDSHKLFVDEVKSGRIVPLTPLHYCYYFNSSILELWKYQVLASSLIIPDVFGFIKTVLPSFNERMKSNLRNLIISEDARTPGNFIHEKHCPEYMKINGVYSVDKVLKEMFIRLMLNGSHIDSLFFITCGKWIGSLYRDENISVEKIELPYINRFFTKFGIESFDVLSKYVDDLVFKGNRVYSLPIEIKKAFRLFKKFPHISKLFLINKTND